MKQITLKTLHEDMLARLTPVVGRREATAMATVIMEDVVGVEKADYIVNGDRTVEPETAERVDWTVRRVVGGEPLQYVVGSAMFHGMRFEVCPGVLIPRPETSALVDIVLDKTGSRRDLSVLDVGTGSGAIAVALARNLPFSDVVAVDNSDVAVRVASANCKRLKAGNVSVMKRDVLKEGLPDGRFDIVVSNPPYVLESEEADMDRRVVDHEPREALFVPDADPLRFYRAIADGSTTRLKKGGCLFFEINPLQADAIGRLLTSLGYDDIEILPDFSGHKRYVTATLK